MSAVAEELALELEGRAKVVKVNVEDAQDAVMRFGVMRLPSFLVVREGQVTARIAGLRSRDELLDLIGPLAE
jgi:thioredoxin 1